MTEVGTQYRQHGRRPERMLVVSALLWLLCLLAGIQAQAAGFTARSYPAPINVDSHFIRTSMYLRFEVKDMNIAVDDFAKANLTPEEVQFVRVAQYIHAKNDAALAEIWGDPRPKKPAVQGAVSISDIKPNQVVAEYAADFADLHKPRLISEVLVGSATLFVWETASDGTPIRLGLQVVADEKNKLWIQDINSSQDPIANLIVVTMNEVMRDPNAYKPTDNPGTKYRYAFPLAGRADPGKHPVLLQFSGEPMNFPVYNVQVAPPSPLLTAYRNSFLSLKNKKYSEFSAEHHTAESQAHVSQMIPLLTSEKGPPIVQRMTSNKYVKFVLNADPVYFIFYSALDGEDWPPGSLGYDYMYHDPASGKFLLTNFMFQGFWDVVFRNANLFNQFIFKPAITPSVPKQQEGQ